VTTSNPGVFGSIARFTGASTIANSVISQSTEGKIGIGTTAPAEKLHLAGPESRLRLQSTNSNLWTVTEYVTDNRVWHTGVGGSNVPNDVKGKYYVYDETAQQFRMVISIAGRVGIGTTLPLTKLHVENDSGPGAVYGKTSSGLGVRGSSTSGTGVEGTSSSGIGVRGSSGSGNAGQFDGKVQVNGTLTVDGNVCAANVSCASDARLKQNITSLNYGLHHVLRLRPVSWHWKTEPEGKLQMGLVAQEVENVMPELVLREADATKPLGLNYMELLPVMIKATQEQQSQIQRQQKLIEQLQAQLNQVKRTIKRKRTVRR
jgi:hypothetical protein